MSQSFDKFWMRTLMLPGEFDAMDETDQGRWRGTLKQTWNEALNEAIAICEAACKRPNDMGATLAAALRKEKVE